jgi:hypothetical protein
VNASTSILLGIPLAIYRAWVLMTLWGWFVVPFGAPRIGMAWAYGLGVIYWCFKGYRYSTEQEQEYMRSLAGMIGHFLYATILLGFGYVAWRVMR